MRLILLITISFSLFSFVISDTTKNTQNSESNLTLKLDSGYIVKNEGLNFLIEKKLTDTLNSFWHLIKDNDTIGKYYKQNDNNYLVCFIDYSSKYTFETIQLLEFQNDCNIINKQRYFHSNYGSCLDKPYNCFLKYKNFFGIITCGTGSSFSSSNLYLFKKITSQEKLNPIPISTYSNIGIEERILSSDLNFDYNHLSVKYNFEIIINKEITSTLKSTNKKTEIKYHFENENWTTTDSSKFKEIGIIY